MNVLRALARRFGHQPADPELLKRASAATRQAWEEARAKARATAGNA